MRGSLRGAREEITPSFLESTGITDALRRKRKQQMMDVSREWCDEIISTFCGCGKSLRKILRGRG